MKHKNRVKRNWKKNSSGSTLKAYARKMAREVPKSREAQWLRAKGCVV